MKILLAGVASLLFSVPGFATTVSQSQDITQSAQTFTMGFIGLPANTGSFGTFTLKASGDFSDNFGTSEGFSLDFDGLGSLFINESGVLSNSVSGLSLLSFSSVNIVDFYDETITATFSLGSSLLSSMLADNQAVFNIQNASQTDAYYVQAYPGTDPDYVSMSLQYNVAAVPEPATTAMLMAGLGILGMMVRRRT
ncbi:hypothetical protein GCM10027046_24310 [Uliginosibacterium flavum]|uniref:FxDxF family PEP-CTERM protein n=1 Tax=Uliginosibacterium flavum TaxID=1396831 RepID=A0ABV2TKC2_9RHOO